MSGLCYTPNPRRLAERARFEARAEAFGAIRRAAEVARGLDEAPYYTGRLQAASVRCAIRKAIDSPKYQRNDAAMLGTVKT